MPVICIGPVCIPWTAVWPLMVFLFRPLRKIFLKYFDPEKLRKEEEESLKKKEKGVSKEPAKKSKKCCSQSTDPKDNDVRDIKNMEEWEEVFQISKEQNKVIFVDFYSTWCKPCERIKPEFVRLNKTHSKDIFIKTNVDTMMELAMEYGIIALPTFVAFENGEEVGRCTGEVLKKLEGLVSKHTKSTCNTET